MTPIITPTPKKKRLVGIERLQIDIPSADVKKEQRKRRHNSSQEGIDSTDNGLLPTSPCRNDLLPFPVSGSSGNTTTDLSDGNSVLCNMSDDSDNETQSLESNHSNETTTSNEDGDGDNIDFSINLDESKYLNRIIDFNALKEMIELKCTCRLCNGSVLLTEITVGIATTVVITCTKCDENCRRTETGPIQVNGHDICERQGIWEKPQFIRKNIKRFIDFPIHYSLVLLMQ